MCPWGPWSLFPPQLSLGWSNTSGLWPTAHRYNPMVLYLLLTLAAYHFPPLDCPLPWRCEGLWDLPGTHTCTAQKSAGINLLWSKPSSNEIQKLRGPSILPSDGLPQNAVIYTSSWETALGEQATNHTCTKGGQLQNAPLNWLNLPSPFTHLSPTSASWKYTSWKNNSTYALASSCRFSRY